MEGRPWRNAAPRERRKSGQARKCGAKEAEADERITFVNRKQIT